MRVNAHWNDCLCAFRQADSAHNTARNPLISVLRTFCDVIKAMVMVLLAPRVTRKTCTTCMIKEIDLTVSAITICCIFNWVRRYFPNYLDSQDPA